MNDGELFGRKVYCVIGKAGEQGVIVDGLRISFAVEKTARRHPNKAKIAIFNLNKTTAAAVTDAQDRLQIQLFAGYESTAVSMIFQGEIRRGQAKTETSGTDRITTIEASDGGDLYRESRINTTIVDASGKQLIDAISKSFGVKIKLPDDVLQEALAKRFDSITLTGRSADVLDNLADSFGFVWFLEDGALKIVSRDGDTGEIAVLLTPDTGLISAAVQTSKGINGESLLNSGIRPRRIIEIRTEDVKGFFRVQSVELKGDSGYAKPFYTSFEAVQAAQMSEDKRRRKAGE